MKPAQTHQPQDPEDSLGQLLLATQNRDMDAALETMLARPRSEHDARILAAALSFFEDVRQQFTLEIRAGKPVTPIPIISPVDWAVMPPTKSLHVIWQDFRRWAEHHQLHPVVIEKASPGGIPKQSLTVRSALGPL